MCFNAYSIKLDVHFKTQKSNVYIKIVCFGTLYMRALEMHSSNTILFTVIANVKINIKTTSETLAKQIALQVLPYMSIDIYVYRFRNVYRHSGMAMFSTAVQ